MKKSYHLLSCEIEPSIGNKLETLKSIELDFKIQTRLDSHVNPITYKRFNIKVDKILKGTQKFLFLQKFQQSQTIHSTYFIKINIPKFGKFWDVTDYHP